MVHLHFDSIRQIVKKHKERISNNIAITLSLGIPPSSSLGLDKKSTADFLCQSALLDQTDNE